MSRIEEDYGDVPALRITVPRNQHRRSSAFSSELSGRFYEPGSFQKLEAQRQSVKREGERKRKQAERHRQNLEKQQNDIERKALQLLQRKKRAVQRRQRREQSAAACTVQRAWRRRCAQSMLDTMRRKAYEMHCKNELQWQQERLREQREQRERDARKRRAEQSGANVDVHHGADTDASTLFLTQQSHENTVNCSNVTDQGLNSFVDAEVVPTLISAADAQDTCAFSLDGKSHSMLNTPECPVEEDICSNSGEVVDVPEEVVRVDDSDTEVHESPTDKLNTQNAQEQRPPEKEQQQQSQIEKSQPRTVTSRAHKKQQDAEGPQEHEQQQGETAAQAREVWAAELLARYGGRCRPRARLQTESHAEKTASSKQVEEPKAEVREHLQNECAAIACPKLEPGLAVDGKTQHRSPGAIEPAAVMSSHVAPGANPVQAASAVFSPTRNARHKRAVLAAQKQKRRSQRQAQAAQRAAAVKAKVDDEARKQEARARRRKQAAERFAALEQQREAEAQKRADILAQSRHHRELQIDVDRVEQERAFMLLLERQQRIETTETNRLARVRAAAARRARQREREADEEAERKALEKQQKAIRKVNADAAERERRARLRRLGAQQRKAKKDAEVNAARAKAEADENKKRERERKVVVFRATLRQRLARQARQQAKLADAEQARAERMHAEQAEQRAATRARLREQDKKRRRREAAMAHQRELEVEAAREATTQQEGPQVQMKQTAARRRLSEARAHAACEGRRRVSNQVLDIKEYILQKERELNIEPSVQLRGAEGSGDADGGAGGNDDAGDDVGNELLAHNFEFDSHASLASTAAATASRTQASASKHHVPQQGQKAASQAKLPWPKVANRGPRLRRAGAPAKVIGPPKRTHPFLGRGPARKSKGTRKQKCGGRGDNNTEVKRGERLAHHLSEVPPTSSIELGDMLQRARAALAPRGGAFAPESAQPEFLARCEEVLDHESRRLLDLRGERRELEAQLARTRTRANESAVDCKDRGCSDDESVAPVGHFSEVPPCLPCPPTLMTGNGQVHLPMPHDAGECSVRMGSCVNGIASAAGNTGQESQRDGGGFPLNAHADFEHMPLGKASCKPGLSTVESSEYADDDFDSASSYADDFDE